MNSDSNITNLHRFSLEMEDFVTVKLFILLVVSIKSWKLELGERSILAIKFES